LNWGSGGGPVVSGCCGGLVSVGDAVADRAGADAVFGEVDRCGWRVLGLVGVYGPRPWCALPGVWWRSHSVGTRRAWFSCGIRILSSSSRRRVPITRLQTSPTVIENRVDTRTRPARLRPPGALGRLRIRRNVGRGTDPVLCATLLRGAPWVTGRRPSSWWGLVACRPPWWWTTGPDTSRRSVGRGTSPRSSRRCR